LSAREIPQGRPFDPFEYQPIRPDLQNVGHGKSVEARVSHHHRLALGVAAVLEASQDATVAEIEDLGGAPCGNEQRLVLHSAATVTLRSASQNAHAAEAAVGIAPEQIQIYFAITNLFCLLTVRMLTGTALR
jgi:hypothetical protein